MKGIVFTEFLEMVENKFGYRMVDNLLRSNDLESQGIYTSIGTYHHTEMVALLTSLSQNLNIEIPELLKIFGKYLFSSFTKSYNTFMLEAPDAFTFLESIDSHIHVEVQKLYPDAELPTFEIQRVDKNTLIMIYRSARKMADLAYGLIEGCAEYYKENIVISQTAMNEDGSITKFVVIKK